MALIYEYRTELGTTIRIFDDLMPKTKEEQRRRVAAVWRAADMIAEKHKNDPQGPMPSIMMKIPERVKKMAAQHPEWGLPKGTMLHGPRYYEFMSDDDEPAEEEKTAPGPVEVVPIEEAFKPS